MSIASVLSALLLPPGFSGLDAVRSAERGPASATGGCAADNESTPADSVELSSAAGSTDTLTEDEQAEVDELKKADTEVRAHEAAHLAAAGQYARGGANFEYTTGPDGKQYATGGEVQIDTSPIPDDPEATIRKMEVVYRAALAPQKPSAQDRRVAADAQASIRETRAEQQTQTDEEDSATDPQSADSTGQSDAPRSARAARGSPTAAYQHGGRSRAPQAAARLDVRA